MFLGARRLQRDWQVGDGREEAAARAVLARTRPGDLNAAIATLDDFAYYLVTDTASLEASLTTIAASATPCSFALPPPPAGSTLAISAATSGGSVTIAKDPANGWAYAADMKSIALNGTACASAQSGAYASIVASYLCAP